MSAATTKVSRISALATVLYVAASCAVYGQELRTSEVKKSPSAPRITFPYGTLEGLSTNVAWMGDVHDYCLVKIVGDENPKSAAVWKSDVVGTSGSYVATPVLPADTVLYAFVRLHNADGWGPWSAGAEFRTPPGPVVKILKPEHAGRAKGPDVEVLWQIEANEEISSLAISLDGGKPKALPPGTRSHRISGLKKGVHTIAVSARAGESTGSRSATFYVYMPEQSSGKILYTFSLQHLYGASFDSPVDAANAFDSLHVAAVLQGLVNREKPRFYLDYTNVDGFWLAKMREKGGYLEHARLTSLKSVEDAIGEFGRYVKGAVVWDPAVPCTSNIASTICGAEDLIPVRYDAASGSMYDRLIINGPKLKVVHNLVGKFTGKGKIPDSDRDSTGSTKCDAYLWAKMQYLDTGKCNPLKMGYWCDAFWLQHPRDMGLENVGLCNHDYVVANKGFICDLDVWADESPRDDRGQRPGLDRETFMEILLSCYKASGGEIIHVSGFTPWAIKYTDRPNVGGKHGGVATEWELIKLLSAYNGFLDADAIGIVSLANASVFTQCKLPDRLIQNPPPTPKQLQAKGYIDSEGVIAPLNYVYQYMGDYDSAAWIYNRLPSLWQDSVRGQIPAGWAFNPNLIERLPIAFDWFYDTKSPSDYFIAGDSGAGYVNPTQLLPPRKPSGLPSGADAWIKHNIRYYRKLNYRLTGFLINGSSGALTDESNRLYLPFSSEGILSQRFFLPTERKHSHILDGMVVAELQRDISMSEERGSSGIIERSRPGETAFLSFRSILASPQSIKGVNDRIRAECPECRFEPVDPYTYFRLLRRMLGGRDQKRVTYTFDTLPKEIKAGQTNTISVGLRNDGWVTWKSEGPEAVRLHAGFDGRGGGVEAPLPNDVAPGEGVVVSLAVTAPNEPGARVFTLELVSGKDGWFGDDKDMPWEDEVMVL